MAHFRKIPEQYHQEIYKMYASGEIVPDIHQKIVNEWKIDINEKTVYNLIREIRELKLAQFRDMLSKDNRNEMEKLESITEKIEIFAGECGYIDGGKSFLKAASMLVDIYKFKLQLSIRPDMTHNPFINTNDNGKQKLIDELLKIN